MGLIFRYAILISFLFIGAAILNAIGGLVDERQYAALVQFLNTILLIVISVLYLYRKKEI
jgi:hypothetical protein